MTDVTISHERIYDIICNRMGWEPEDAESFIRLAESNDDETLHASMRYHWQAGLRPPEFQWAVRRDFPSVTLGDFNTAAGEVWSELEPGDEETPPTTPPDPLAVDAAEIVPFPQHETTPA